MHKLTGILTSTLILIASNQYYLPSKHSRPQPESPAIQITETKYNTDLYLSKQYNTHVVFHTTIPTPPPVVVPPQPKPKIKPKVIAPVAPSVTFPDSKQWQELAFCESSGNPKASNGSHFGLYQFDISTWLSVGGGKYAPRADMATPAQQLEIAQRLYALRSWEPWACARKLGFI